MGIDYSFQVYVHQRDAARFLTAVAALCDGLETRRTTVLLSNGTSLELPGTYGFEADRTIELAKANEAFDLSPCFPPDNQLRSYEATHGNVARPWPDGTTRFLVGYTYLMVSDGSDLLPGHWVFDFTPATSSQSRLFLSSPSVRATFATLAVDVGSPLCLLDVEHSYKIIVTAQDHQVSVQVPGPCLLWDSGAPSDEAYQELLARLSGEVPSTTPRFILDPDHPGYPDFVATLNHHSRITGAVR